MTVAVFGCGFVGTAVADWLEANTDRIVLRVDPKFDWYDPQEAVFHAQDIIVCVPLRANQMAVAMIVSFKKSWNYATIDIVY